MVAAAPAAAAAMRKSFLVPEIKPLDQYDFPRARSAASLAWVLAKAYGGAGTAGGVQRGGWYGVGRCPLCSFSGSLREGGKGAGITSPGASIVTRSFSPSLAAY